VQSARNAFGPAPLVLPLELEPKERSRSVGKTMRALRERMPSRTKSKNPTDSGSGI
jgi:hypothetical protein